jgi:signal transduction histidine kinase
MKTKKEDTSTSVNTGLEKELAEVTRQLEQKNRDLEIETALERVRAVAMAMRTPNELLGICEVLFEELTALGFDELRNAMINVFDDDKSAFLNYDYSPDAGQTITHHFYDGHPVIEKMVKESRSAEDAFSETVFAGKDLDDWKAFRKEKGEKDDPRVDNITALYYYFYSVGTAAIGMSAFSPINEEKRIILKRFRNVFDFAYRRYTDVAQAEAQAREAQIELALERVRARTMAMQKSDELQEAANLLFQQVQELGLPAWSAGYAIWDEDKKACTLYMSSEGVLQPPFRAPLTEEASFIHFYEAWQRGEAIHVEEIGGEALVEHYKYMRTLPGIGEMLDKIADAGFPVPTFQILHSVYFSQGFLLFITYEPVPAAWDIFKRFAKVFEQTYTRFLDLQKAEAQAREAQIELSLERLRSRAMAMHKTDELMDVAELLYREVTGLGIGSLTVRYVLVSEQDKTGTYYGINPVDGKVMATPVIMPYAETKVMRALLASWLKQEPVYFIAMGPKASIKHQTYIGNLMATAFKAAGTADWFTVEGFLSVSPERIHIYSLNFRQGYLLMVCGAPLAAADVDILTRFAKVFELTYTRFLDLQKAEAQAREAQIELALERVRAKTMAMHNSEDVGATVATMFDELVKLGVDKTMRCGVGIIHNSKEFEVWTASTKTNGDVVLNIGTIDMMTHPLMAGLYDEWKGKKDHYTYLLLGEEVKNYYRAINATNCYTVKFDIESLPSIQYHNSFIFPEGAIYTFSPEPLTAEVSKIVKRFSSVFGQTYRRYRDLQIAETQAREAHIQLALERVRARTMAMQHSDELAETAYILFQQFGELGENPDQATIGIINEAEGVIEYWVTIHGGQTNKVFKFPVDEPNVTGKIYKAWKTHKKSLVIDLSGKALHDFSKFRESMGGAGYNPEEKRRIINVAFFSKGLINVQSTVERSVESLRLLERFANVFEGTYTRFLDLKRVEAQAREAEIELGLERVRARAMAMQNSDELHALIDTVFNELTKLDLVIARCRIWIFDPSALSGMTWQANSEVRGNAVTSIIKHNRHPFYLAVLKAWKERNPKWAYELKGREKQSWDQFLFSETGLAGLSEVIKEGMRAPERILLSASFSNFGAIQTASLEPLSDEQMDILARFVKVFDMTYTRFNDLKQAEAQAREAQIQLAMERVRARTMAMQQSAELAETASLVSQQLQTLGLSFSRVGFYIWQKDTGLVEGWTSNGTFDGLLPPLELPYMEDDGHRGIYEAAQRGEHSYEQVLGGDELKRHYEWLLSQPSVWGTLRKTGDNAFVPMQIQYKYAGIFKQGYLMLMAAEPQPGAGDLLARFALVFEQTYTRFLDLQKAEAQARESKIQLAMERVRAKTMAMQHSDELAGAASLLFKQVSDFGINVWSSAFQIWNADDISTTAWASAPDGSFQAPFRLPYNEDIFFKRIYEARQSGKDFFVMESSGKELEDTYHYMFNLPGVKKYFDDAQDLGFPIPKYQITHCAFFPTGYLMFITYEPCPEMWDIFKRFAKVFEQTYTRFLDLKKAEEHSKEAQIELALERVRARAMAMHSSDELIEVANVLREQMGLLGQPDLETSAVHLYDDNSETFEAFYAFRPIFGSDRKPISKSTTFPKDSCEFLREMTAMYRSKVMDYTLEVSGLKRQEWLVVAAKAVPEIIENTLANDASIPDTTWFHFSDFHGGSLVMVSYQQPSEEAKALQRRAASVFDLAYRRFLDLKKAEAQAREAQIEAALERVRSKTMAMHNSQDVGDTIAAMFSEFVKLGIETIRCGILIGDSSDEMEVWTAKSNPDGAATLIIGRLDTMIHPLLQGVNAAWRNKKSTFEYRMTGNDLKDYYGAINNANYYPVQFDIDSLPPIQFHTDFFFADGAVFAFTVEPIADSVAQIFKRFAGVFGQTYRRYLDLKKAEAQAREAKIEAALERVRSRTMGMQRSDELQGAALLLFQQAEALGVNAFASGFNIWDEDRKFATAWMGSVQGLQQPFKTDSSKDIYLPIYEAAQRGDAFFVREQAGEELKVHYDYLATIPIFRDIFMVNLAKMGFAIPSFQIIHCAFFAQGYLMFISYDPCPEAYDLFKRFAKVFEQTYTRFLDLQKAEEQAREAKIQLSLERVRASAMAMHHSDELSQVLSILFEQFDVLDIRPVDAHLDLFDLEKNTFSYRATGKEGTRVIAEQIVDLDSRPEWQSLAQRWKQGKPRTVDFSYYPKEVIRDLMAFFPDIWAAMPSESIMNPEVDFPDGMYDALGYCKFGYLGFHHNRKTTEDENRILIRFTNEFERLYQRFLDLQKAEAQARESQIQLALERVRARTMAMQHSEELPETASVLFQQFNGLGVTPERIFIGTINDETRLIDVWGTEQGGTQMSPMFTASADATFSFGQIYKAWQAKKRTHTVILKGKDLDEHVAYIRRGLNMPMQPELIQEQRILYNAYFSKGLLVMVTPEIQSQETLDILERFAAVFDGTYTRFLDLQKAEAQARESQIQLGLERVRAKAMAMQTSEELNELIGTVFGELTKLDFVLTRCLIMIFDPETNSSRWWMANSEDPSYPMNYLIQYHKHDAYTAYLKAWKGRDLKWRYELKGKFKKTWDDFLFVETELSQLPGPVIVGMKAPENVLLQASFNNFGCLTLVSLEPLSDEHFDILLRFAKVFDMTYTRFNDLKQAEAQAREAQIEASLERVRSRTMGMQKSDELKEVIQLIYEQLKQLNFNIDSANFAVDYRESDDFNLWLSSAGQSYPTKVHTPYVDLPIFNRSIEAKKNEVDFLAENYSFEEKNAFFNHFFKNVQGVSDERKEFVLSTAGYARSTVFMKNVALTMQNYAGIPYSEEENAALRRFGKVFEQTYTRFLDLQNAEEQAREAKIEAALERVRSRTMAMQKSDELHEVIQLVFDQLQQLSFNIDVANFALNYKETDDFDLLLAVPNGKYPVEIHIPYFKHPVFDRFNNAKEGGSLLTDTLTKDEKDSFFEHFFKYADGVPKETKASIFGRPGFVRSSVLLKNTALTIHNYDGIPYSEAENNTLLRFGQVFEQTYTRFLDLKKAEEQAREAKIEAALEKVRGKAMAMYNSKDLSAAASMVFTELRKLGINPLRCGVGMVSKGSEKVQLYSATTSTDGDSLSLMGWVKLSGHPVLEKILESILKLEDYFPVLKGKQLKAYYENLLSGLSLPSVPDWQTGNQQYGHFFSFMDGCLYAWSEKPYSAPDIKILKRFASVIDLTFRRYVELQKSEASARDAVREASLDRVRAEIASMRTTDDLGRITPLVWNELIVLNVPFIRCGVFIIDEQEQLIHTHLSTADGKALAAFDLQFDSEGIGQNVLPAWRKKQIATIHWTEEEFATYTNDLVERGSVKPDERYVTEHPNTTLDLHFLPFLQGMLYVGNTSPLTSDEINLVQSLADAFSTAYARYEDFNKLEAAKQQVDNTLTELKAAQTKLIQSEKMASLGELTAGIAHEIQNPLNFVNNFSEVNKELLEELKAESEKPKAERDEQLEIDLINDMIENEAKINHHGKRADAIVKGMLQHSQSGTGARELTNINALADEYMRLAYHGLRAKDKSFNAEMHTHFDQALPKISAIGQDIGRVLLNLFNNAFYAVSKKQKTAGEGYNAEVSVSTAIEKGQVVITVKDNGIGIPDAIKEKIMQPFFTTKPTGEGTGLGLSLTYDMVVKGHGGSIQVESVEGEGSEFIIKLPIN